MNSKAWFDNRQDFEYVGHGQFKRKADGAAAVIDDLIPAERGVLDEYPADLQAQRDDIQRRHALLSRVAGNAEG